MRADRWILFLLGWLSAAYFVPRDPGWNVNTRLALTYAIVDEHRLTIDTFHDAPGYATGDKAFFEGHFYSDKVIGNALLAVPVYQFARWTGVPLSPVAKHWLCSAFTVAPMFGLVLVLLAGLMERQGVTRRDANLLSVLGGLGTMLFPYSTFLMPYAPACALGLLGYRLTLPVHQQAGVLHMGRVFVAGLCLGLMLLFELLFGLVMLAVLAHVAITQSARLKAVPLFVAGVVLGLSPFFFYSFAIFGSLSVPYEFEHDPFFREAMATGFMGIHLPPDPRVLVLITVHPFRGLFIYSPLLLVALGGLTVMFRENARRAAMCLALFVGYLLVNAGYRHQWWGGWACGPRLLIPALPFLLLGLPAVWMRWPRMRPVIIILGIVSIGFQLLAAGIDPQPPTPVPGGDANAYLMQARLDQWYPNPLTTWWWPRLMDGAVTMNVGELLGLRGLVSWVLLLLMWMGAAFALLRPDQNPAEH